MTPTKADLARFDAFRRIGCVACRKNGHAGVPADVHHLLVGGKRAGHRYTVPLCAWHHRGVTMQCSKADMTEDFGPSLAHGSKAFKARYGDDGDLLAYTDQLIFGSDVEPVITAA